MQIDIGISEQHKQEITDGLARLLADSDTLHQRTFKKAMIPWN